VALPEQKQWEKPPLCLPCLCLVRPHSCRPGALACASAAWLVLPAACGCSCLALVTLCLLLL
jgi:hypothetical protein